MMPKKLNLICKGLTLAILLLVSSSSSYADETNRIEKILDLIGDSTDRLCLKIPFGSQVDRTEWDVTGKAETDGLFKKLADLGINLNGTTGKQNSHGIIPEDLPDVINRNIECREKVFTILADQILPLIPPESEPPEKTPPVGQSVDYKVLKYYLANDEFIKADEETSDILLRLTGNLLESHNPPADAAKIDCSIYQTIDQLWREHSKVSSGESKFGFSVQRGIWISEGNYEKFGEKVGWRRNNNWLTYDDLNNDIARNLEEVPAGYLPSKFRGEIAKPTLYNGWMLWSLLPNHSAGKCFN